MAVMLNVGQIKKMESKVCTPRRSVLFAGDVLVSV